MALKIHAHVSHGYIDNRYLDHVRGRIWFVGREKPLELDLEGNCLRDIAGGVLTFRNKYPSQTSPHWVQELETEQTGILGDMTASARRRVIDDGQSKWINELSLEWFQPGVGRILLRSPAYDMEFSKRAWNMCSYQEQAQLMVNQSAMRDYVVFVLKKTWETPLSTEEDAPRIPFLPVLKKGQSSAFVMQMYMEVCEKYGNTQDGEVNRAYAMGWDHVLSAMAHTEETGEAFYFSDLDECETSPDADLVTEEAEARICRGHPLYERVQQFAVQAHEWVKYFPVEIVDTWRPQYQFLQGIYSIIERLALVLILMSRKESNPDKLVCPLTKAMEKAERVGIMFDKEMDLPGSEYLREEMSAEWKSICKELAKLRIKIERGR